MENLENKNKIRPDLSSEENHEIPEIPAEELDEIQIPSSEELEELKESDFESYVYWSDVISKNELIKHELEMEQIGKEIEEEKRKEDLDKLYKNDTDEQRRESHLYGHD